MPEPPLRSRALGGLLRVAGVLVILAAVGLWLGSVAGVTGLSSSIGVGLAALLGSIGGAVSVYGKRLSAPSAEEVLAADPRPPVLYLRSFRDDGKMGMTEAGAMIGLPGETTEELVTRALARIGPCVAIGKPGEKLPELGAARLYVGNAEWQEKVNELLARSALVLLRAGETEGFWWEVERVFRSIPPEKVLFLLSWGGGPKRTAREEEAYAAFRTRANEVLPVPLPDKLGDACFLAFEAGWKPMLLGTIGRLWQAGYFKKTSYLDEGLAPVLARFGVKAERPRMVGRWVWILAAILAVLTAAFLIALRQ